MDEIVKKKNFRTNFPFNLVGLGGSFDHLHHGHKKLLSVAFKMGRNVAIALTTEKLLEHKEYNDKIESYQVREKNMRDYIENTLKVDPSIYTIMPLDDPFGSAITEENLAAHISSEESYKVSLKINEIRKEKGLKPFILIIVPFVRDELGERISSTNIRENLL